MPNYLNKREARQNSNIKLTNQAIRTYLETLMFNNVVLIKSINSENRTFTGQIIPSKLRQKIQLEDDESGLKLYKTEQTPQGSSSPNSFVTMKKEDISISGIIPVGFKIVTDNKETLESNEIAERRSIVLCSFLDIDFTPLFQKWKKFPSSMPKIGAKITDEPNENFHSRGSAVIVLKIIDLMI